MWIPDFVLKFFGHSVATKLNLEDTPNMDTPWYKNKSTLSHIVAFLIGVYGLVGTNIGPDFHFAVPTIPAWVLTILGALGVYDNHSA